MVQSFLDRGQLLDNDDDTFAMSLQREPRESQRGAESVVWLVSTLNSSFSLFFIFLFLQMTRVINWLLSEVHYETVYSRSFWLSCLVSFTGFHIRRCLLSLSQQTATRPLYLRHFNSNLYQEPHSFCFHNLWSAKWSWLVLVILSMDWICRILCGSDLGFILIDTSNSSFWHYQWLCLDLESIFDLSAELH